MKFFTPSLCVSAALALGAVAQADLKVATVDMQKLFADYYKTHEAQAEVDKEAQKVQADNATRTESIKKMEVELSEIAKKAQDPSLDDKTKKDLEQKFQITRQQGVALEQERRGYVERQLKTLQEKMKIKATAILEEITKVTNDAAKKNHYDLILDKSAKSAGGSNVFVFTKEEMDITPIIMKELNKEAPEGFDPSKKKSPEAPIIPTSNVQ